MAIDLETESQVADQDITSEFIAGEYQNTSGGTIYLSSQIRLSKLNGAAATLTIGLVLRQSNGTTKLGTYKWSQPKDAAADTVFSADADPIRVEDDEKVYWSVLSSNASDNNGGGAGTGPDIDIVWTAPYGAVDVAKWAGTAVVAGAIPAVAADGAGGLPTTTKITDARLGALTDWIDAGRLDLILDAILADTDEVQSRIDEMTEDDSGTRRFTANALENLFVVDMDQMEGEGVIDSLCTLILTAFHGNLVDNPGKLTVYKTDGTTEVKQFDITSSDTASPVTGVG